MKGLEIARGDLEARLAAFFRHRGFTLHKCCARGGEDHTVGGLCLTPEPDGAVLVGWAPHRTDEFHADMIVVLRKALERADYTTESGPIGTTVRVRRAP